MDSIDIYLNVKEIADNFIKMKYLMYWVFE